MNIKEFSRELERKSREVDDLFRRRLPVIVGRMAKDHYQNNFRKGGFVDGGLHRWPPAKRINANGKKAADRYGTLLSRRNHLFSSIRYIPGDSRVKVDNPVIYAPAHQYGETLQPTVTPKMRRFAWAKYYEYGGGIKSGANGLKTAEPAGTSSGGGADFWKNLALTKKTRLTVKLPARPFIGPSRELTTDINRKTDSELIKILNK